MKKRTLGKTGKEVSILGFGCMRLPLTDPDDPETIDEEKAAEMLRYAIDNGVNYLDTAWPYHNGMSEPFLGRVLKDGYREKVYLASKLPSWEITSREQMDEVLNKQLERLQTDCIEFYLVHTLNVPFWNNLKKLGVFDFLEKAKKDGKIKHIGFSYHDELPLFKEIVDAYPWEFCQIQYNYLDTAFQAGSEGLAYAADRGLGIIIMEPVRGGTLAGPFSEAVNEKFEKSERNFTPVEWALRWLWDDERVHLVLSGMSSMEQTQENVETALDAEAGAFSDSDHNTINAVREAFLASYKVPCTACGYCMPCPSGVNIPNCFRQYNALHFFPEKAHDIKFQYNAFIPELNRASKCVECGACEEHCPQHIQIIDNLKGVVESFGS